LLLRESERQPILARTPTQGVADPAFNRDFQMAIRLLGDVAVESAAMASTQDCETHADLVLRLSVHGSGEWQLLSHAAVASAQ